MLKVYLYGASKKGFDNLFPLSLNFQVLGFIDSNKDKRNSEFSGLPVYHYTDLKSLEFDKIIITSSYANEIESILDKINIHEYINVDDLNQVKKIQEKIKTQHQLYKRENLNKIPKVPLNSNLIKNTRLLTNRRELLNELPKNGVVAELGVANGDFTQEILEYSTPEKLHLVDIWGSSRYGENLFKNVNDKFLKEINSNTVEIHRKLSIEAVNQFPDQYFDWVYIDTDHSYTTTIKELELYQYKIKSGGFLTGHDYTQGNWEADYKYGVIEAVHEFCSKHNFQLRYLTMDIAEAQSFAIQKL
ncbi:class I SAM-dependent methyltransferase [Neptunicella sp.]|uniref:class I SAM-dependent methyltransferase n=1 Tax=Neptunicella sp. TaxID=2125986 RepID=UPI003F68E339